MAQGSLWKNDGKFVVQLSKVSRKDKKVIFDTFQEWNKTGAGFNKDGTEIFLFTRTGVEDKEVFSLVKGLPFPFTEEKSNGISKKIRTKYAVLTKTSVRAKVQQGRTCSKCGIKGHNSRTCKR